MKTRLARAAIVLCLASLSPVLPVFAQDRSLDDLVQAAHFIFIGDVVKLGSSNMASVPPTANTAVVRVRDVLTLEPMFGGMRGREITVEMLQPQRLEKTLFFTNIVVYGTSLDAIEVTHQSAERGGDVIRRDIRAAEARNRERAVAQRIARAAIVVAGTVTDVSRKEQGMPKSEHDPLWAVAFVKVSGYLKGQGPDRIQVLFPTSTDELWIDSPKFKPGDSGIWILQRDQQEKGFPKLRVPGLTALDPLDFQPPTALSRMRDLIAQQKK